MSLGTRRLESPFNNLVNPAEPNIIIDAERERRALSEYVRNLARPCLSSTKGMNAHIRMTNGKIVASLLRKYTGGIFEAIKPATAKTM